jgi:hypothetical protein
LSCHRRNPLTIVLRDSLSHGGKVLVHEEHRYATLSRPPPTRRVGLRDLTSAMADCVVSASASRLHQPKKSPSLSTRHLRAGALGARPVTFGFAKFAHSSAPKCTFGRPQS